MFSTKMKRGGWEGVQKLIVAQQHSNKSIFQILSVLYSVSLSLYSGTLVLWCSGLWALVLWYSGTLVLWYSGTLVLWYSGTLALWHFGTLALWHFGTLVLWYSGTYPKTNSCSATFKQIYLPNPLCTLVLGTAPCRNSSLEFMRMSWFPATISTPSLIFLMKGLVVVDTTDMENSAVSPPW